MKKLWVAAPVMILMLYGCNEQQTTEPEVNTEKPAVEQLTMEQKEVTTERVWVVDERLGEPAENTTCFMCNMKVHMKDDEQGVFSAQAVRENGEVVFYDDIGCLLNDEYVHEVENEKFVRDYYTLNWFNVDEAIAVKTDLQSPMNWGYIFFKYEEDAQAYMDAHAGSEIVAIDAIRQDAIERHQKKQAHQGDDHTHGQMITEDSHEE